MNERKQLSALTLVLFAFATLCAVLLIIGGLFFFGLGSIERSNQREQSRALKKLAVIDDIGQDVGEMQASVAREGARLRRLRNKPPRSRDTFH